jgi:hypothetical protein
MTFLHIGNEVFIRFYPAVADRYPSASIGWKTLSFFVKTPAFNANPYTVFRGFIVFSVFKNWIVFTFSMFQTTA